MFKNSARIMTAFPGNRMGGVFYNLCRNTPVHEVSPPFDLFFSLLIRYGLVCSYFLKFYNFPFILNLPLCEKVNIILLTKLFHFRYF